MTTSAKPESPVARPPAASPPAAASPQRPGEKRADDKRTDDKPAGGADKGSPAAARDDGKPATPPPGTPPAAPRGGFGSGLLGGIIGGAAAAALVVTLWPSDDSVELAPLVNQVESAAATAEGQSARLDELADQLAALETTAGTDADVSGRLDALEGLDVANRLDAIESSAVTAGQAQFAAELGEVDGRLTALENELAAGAADAAASSEGDEELLATFEARIAALEASVAATDTAVDQRLTAVEGAREQVDQRLTALEGVGEQVDQLGSGFDVLSDQVVADRSQTMTLADEMAALATRVAGAENRLDSADDLQARATALALLTSELGNAITRAEPYDKALQELVALGGGDEVVDAAATQLEPGAEAGIPNLAALQDALAGAMPEIVGEGAAGEDAGMLDQASGNLFRLVTVRPVGAETEGDDAAAAVARAEARLAAGDLPAAITEIESLEAVPAAADWLQSARLRRDADAALETLRARTRELLTTAP